MNIFLKFFYKILVVLSGVFNLFMSAIFFLGAEEDAKELLAQHGIIGLFLQRFVIFMLLGFIISLLIVALSVLIDVFRNEKAWLFQRKLFKEAFTLQSVCVLIGSLFFTFYHTGFYIW